jgi:hypothetical protein
LCCVCRLAKDLEIKAKLEEEAKAKAEAAAADNKVPLSPRRPWTCKHQGMRAWHLGASKPNTLNPKP